MVSEDRIGPVDASNDDKGLLERETQEEMARISRVATMLRAQKLALAFEGTMLSGGLHRFAEPPPSRARPVWLVAVRREPRQPRMRGGDMWRGNRFRTWDVQSLPTLGTRPALNGRRKT